MSNGPETFVISGPLDHGGWSGLRRQVVLSMAVAIAFDGMSNQLLGLAAPAIAADMHLTPSAFAEAVAAGMAGLGVGGLFGGLVADRMGRRRASLASILVLAIATIATAWAKDLRSLAILRFAAGLGLGGLMPCAITLIAEFTPLRVRSATVMAAISCVPGGGILAAMLASTQMREIGWRPLFAITGIGALCLGLVLMFVLPESPRYLVQYTRLHPQLSGLLRRLGIDTHGASSFVDGRQTVGRTRLAVLFREPYLRDTLALCSAFFFCSISSYSFLSWLPTTLSKLGLSYAMQGVATALFNVGGIVGVLAGAAVLNRLGSRLTTLALSACSVAGAVFLTRAEGIAHFSPWALILCLALLAASLGIVQSALFSLSVHMFPAPVRATGSGIASAAGRIGALASSFTAAIALQLGGAGGFFVSIAFAMLICGACLVLIRQHVPAALGT